MIVPSNQSISSHGVSLLSLPHIMWMTTRLPKHLEMVPSQTTDTRCHTQGLCPGGGGGRCKQFLPSKFSSLIIVWLRTLGKYFLVNFSDFLGHSK